MMSFHDVRMGMQMALQLLNKGHLLSYYASLKDRFKFDEFAGLLAGRAHAEGFLDGTGNLDVCGRSAVGRNFDIGAGA
jgi:hypothetical protein